MLRKICAFLLLTIGIPGVWPGSSVADTTQPADAKAAAEQTESQKIARTRVMEMAGFLAAADKFSVTVRAGYDVVQENGQKVEFGEIREISIQRPDKIRVEEMASHGARNLMIFDGKNISILDGETNLYAQAPQPGDIDTSVVYFVRGLKMRLPLAPLLMRHFPQELEKRLQSIDLVEETDIMGQPALHLAGRTASVDFQAWVAEGDQPLPLRIILSYREAEGQPQFWANFSKWNLTPTIDSAAFVFTPPKDAMQIMFAAQFQPAVDKPRIDEKQNQGGKQ